MFGIGPLELMAIAAVALVVLGPRRLPEVARQAGRFMAEVRRTTYDLRSTLDAELQAEDRDRRRSEAEDRRRKFREERDRAKSAGEWPPGGKQDADRPGPTVGEVSDPSQPAAPTGPIYGGDAAAPASSETGDATPAATEPAAAAPPAESAPAPTGDSSAPEEASADPTPDEPAS